MIVNADFLCNVQRLSILAKKTNTSYIHAHVFKGLESAYRAGSKTVKCVSENKLVETNKDITLFQTRRSHCSKNTYLCIVIFLFDAKIEKFGFPSARYR